MILRHLGHYCLLGTTEEMNKDKPRKRRRTGFQDIEEEDYQFTVEAAVVDGKVEKFNIASTDQISEIAGLGVDFPEPLNNEVDYHFEDINVENTGTKWNMFLLKDTGYT